VARKISLILALALLLTCGPSVAVPSSSPELSPSPLAIASTDLITLREGGQQSSIAVRKVATSDLVRAFPDGLLLPDGLTLVTVESGGAASLVKKIDWRTGATTASRTIDGTWQLYRGYPTFTGASADGSRLVLFGSSYNMTDPNGSSSARTTFGIVDLATWRVDPIELAGRYAFSAVSKDGGLAYLSDYGAQPPRLRVYDLKARALGEVQGEPLAIGAAVPTYIGGSAFMVVNATETLQVSPDHLQVGPVTKLVRVDLSQRMVRVLRLPIDRALNGEEALAWSRVASADGKTLYAVNPAVGLVYEIDVASLQIRRSAGLNSTQSRSTFIDGALALLHPVAEAKMGFGTGAILSPNGATLYVLGVQGIWSVDVASLKVRVLTKDGAYETMKVSPDGRRLYTLGREDGVVSAIDTDSGRLLGSMKRLAFPSEIVAVDAG
jgi:DNA-binding beta-propeller fold protein YncE